MLTEDVEDYSDHLAKLSTAELHEEMLGVLDKVLDDFEGGDPPSENKVKSLRYELARRTP